MMHVEGYHEYFGGCSIHWGIPRVYQGMFSISGDIMMHVGEQVDKSFSGSIENPNVLNIP